MRTSQGRNQPNASHTVEAQSAAGAQMVSLDVPASTLSTEITLNGLREGKAPQDTGYYYFRVQKQ